MRDPDEYAHRVRALPYGPVESAAGAVSIWLHGPYVVVTLTGDDTSVRLTGAGDDDGLAADLVEFFEAGSADGGELRAADRLTMERPAWQDEADRVQRLRFEASPGLCRLVLQTTGSTVPVVVDRTDFAVYAGAVREWAQALGSDREVRSLGARAPQG